MVKFKTTNGVMTGFVPGVGDIVNGIIDAPYNWAHSSNFERVEADPPTNPPQTTPAAVPNPPTNPPQNSEQTTNKTETA